MIAKALPGLALIGAIAVIARLAGRFTGPVPDVVLALLIGIALRNFARLPATIPAGTKFTLFYGLRTAIILLGAGLSLDAVVKTGSTTLIVIVTCVVAAMLLGLGAARVMRLKRPLGTLLGAGTAICGASAILTVGPLTGASEEEIAYAISTIFTFNIIALLAYPPIGHALGLSAVAFGSWAGTAVNDTSVVVATGYVFGPAAGAVATIVKLTRTVLLVPLAVVVGATFAAQSRAGESFNVWERALKATPVFVLGFLAMAALNSFHLFSPALSHALTTLAGFLIVMVLAAVGLNVNIANIRALGLRPLFVGLAIAAIMSLVSLGLIYALKI